MIIASGHPTTADKAAAGVCGLVAAVFFAGMVLYATRWRRIRGATSHRDALQRAFGDSGVKYVQVVVGCCVLAMIAVGAVVGISGG
jgi:Na+/proline symporter